MHKTQGFSQLTVVLDGIIYKCIIEQNRLFHNAIVVRHGNLSFCAIVNKNVGPTKIVLIN